MNRLVDALECTALLKVKPSCANCFYVHELDERSNNELQCRRHAPVRIATNSGMLSTWPTIPSNTTNAWCGEGIWLVDDGVPITNKVTRNLK